MNSDTYSRYIEAYWRLLKFHTTCAQSLRRPVDQKLGYLIHKLDRVQRYRP